MISAAVLCHFFILLISLMKPTTDVIKKRYDRIAPYFELIEAMMEGLFLRRRRKQLWEKIDDTSLHILEVGVGTGKNFPFYPPFAEITAIDFSSKMLKQAQVKRDKQPLHINLEEMDVQQLYFADNSFDTVIATCVFCSVPMPLKGLKELYRVCKPGGQVLLLEHVLSSYSVLALLMNGLNPLVVRLVGANINRDTLKHVKSCPFQWVRVDERSGDIIKLIEARK